MTRVPVRRGGTRELTSAGDLTWVRKRQDFLGHDPVTGDLHGQVGPPMKHAVTEDAEGCVVLSDLEKAPSRPYHHPRFGLPWTGLHPGTVPQWRGVPEKDLPVRDLISPRPLRSPVAHEVSCLACRAQLLQRIQLNQLSGIPPPLVL